LRSAAPFAPFVFVVPTAVAINNSWLGKEYSPLITLPIAGQLGKRIPSRW
jgi:hypothetical protein